LANKPRMYQAIWDKILANTSEVPVRVRCPIGNQPRLIQAVKKLKTEANTLRRDVDAVGYGRLIVGRNGEWVTFKITFNGDQI
jgi:hypothetical protein